MAEAPVPDRPNTQSNVCPWLKVPGHADVLIRTMEATWAAAAQSSASRLPELASPSSHRIPVCRGAAVHLPAGHPSNAACPRSARRPSDPPRTMTGKSMQDTGAWI